MKVLYTAMMADARGKLNGTVASKNRAGAYMRTKVTPVNRRTSFQTMIRAAFTAFTKAWSGTLTEAQRQAFTAFAHLHPITDIFGNKRLLDGKAMYISMNTALTNAGLALVTAPPTVTATGELGALTLVATIAAGGTLTLATNETGVDVTSKINVYSTPVQPNGVNFVKSQLRYIGNFASAGTPYNIKADWIAKFGTFPTVASGKIFVAVQIITTGGILSTPAATAKFLS
jgi:hypothetical protein